MPNTFEPADSADRAAACSHNQQGEQIAHVWFGVDALGRPHMERTPFINNFKNDMPLHEALRLADAARTRARCCER